MGVVGMVKDQLKRFPFVVQLHAGLRGGVRRLRSAMPAFKRQLLTAALVVTYFIIVTPIAFVRRMLLGRSLAHPAANAQRGWQPIRQSSADKRIYLSDY
jgi:hypothetical protein